MKRLVNIGNAIRDFCKEKPEAVTAFPSIGYKLQVANLGLVHTMTAEDIETLYQFASFLRDRAGKPL